MYVSLTSFTNPFSFFCIPENEHIKCKNAPVLDNYAVGKPRMDFTQLEHGQYIAVLYDDTWARGIISLENQVLIWLVDHGMYLRPNLQTVYKELPASYKKLPSKVFEASLHGIVPVEKTIKDFSEIRAVTSTTWVKGAVEEAKEWIDKAEKIRFEPLALISTKNNDVVLGDLYLYLNGYYVHIVDVLEKTPMYLERDKQFYIENLHKIYENGRHHHACPLKPELPGNIPAYDISDLNIQTYNTLCENIPKEIPRMQNDTESDIATNAPDDDDDLQIILTPNEMEEYSMQYISLGGKEVNVLNLLKNKAKDFVMCNKYKNLRSVGRATSRRHFEDAFYL